MIVYKLLSLRSDLLLKKGKLTLLMAYNMIPDCLDFTLQRVDGSDTPAMNNWNLK